MCLLLYIVPNFFTRLCFLMLFGKDNKFLITLTTIWLVAKFLEFKQNKRVSFCRKIYSHISDYRTIVSLLRCLIFSYRFIYLIKHHIILTNISIQLSIFCVNSPTKAILHRFNMFPFTYYHS